MTVFLFGQNALAHILFLHGLRESNMITQRELEELLTQDTLIPEKLPQGAAEVIYPLVPDMIDIIASQMNAGRRRIGICKDDAGQRYIHADFYSFPEWPQGTQQRDTRHR